ncbi:deoxyribodipyrimidine photo-lyase [Lepeophtheirus salmonis]|uniref:deoxyribodipyrimidine photo-lyase n=1 Tax=Lepeophtheirus salmonis TaxID=72036 RepID=UPI001AE464BC|nr:deoxyribodipyrimidine photo-lyase-like [Lepeophtheirus salmonis]
MPNSIFWFRRDLRLGDNPGLVEAAKLGKVLCVYIFEDRKQNAADFSELGSGTKAWLHYALDSLNKTLGGKLFLARGNPLDVLKDVAQKASSKNVFCNHIYEPMEMEMESHIIKELKSSAGITLRSFNSSLLWEPQNILQQNGKPYKIFTHFYKKGCLNYGEPRSPLVEPSNLNLLQLNDTLTLEDLQLLSKDSPNLTVNEWNISEKGANERLESFLQNGLDNYKIGRDFPSQHHVSRLSPYLRFGQISPNIIWYAARKVGTPGPDLDHFSSELGWREFSVYLLHHWPHIPRESFNPNFKGFPWKDDEKALAAWKEGRTGVPIVDAGMRELLQTGYMHNRLRMIVASYLVKNLMIHWHRGEDWFWDKLLDADLASNSASWQWVVGCGADAAPYFRIFNPILQSEKFDPEGVFIRKYVPELTNVPTKHLFAPWEATDTVMKNAGVIMGKTYPRPLVDFKKSRQAAQDAFDKMNNKG